MKKNFAVIFAVVAAVLKAELIDYKDCGSKGAVLHSVYLHPCSKLPCTLQRGQNYSVNVNFTAEANIGELTSVAHALFEDMSVPWPLPDSNSCHSMNGPGCPLVTGHVYSTSISINVPQVIPQVRLVIKLEMVTTENLHEVFCLVFPAILQD
ncbi:epididymal secretory protein E1 [Lingula anatina]|uniref:Epididymal secretory protein E1 n=1 Tax=Lingula anatina TaxID=7574 RepID=A0A1S3IPE1_LINAN|nr:epididymal secretory protein E1 [Lingula anatina]|eukprot:XP_013400077.1 epididymal secretory protein E1 [Lingula anatina]